MSNTYESKITDEYLADYNAVKSWLNGIRNRLFPVMQAVRGFSFEFSKLFSSFTVYHLIPYVSSVYTVLESLRLIAFTPFQNNKTRLQKATIISKAVANIALTALFTFVFHSPYAGSMAIATTELVYNAAVTTFSKIFPYYKKEPKLGIENEEQKIKNIDNARTNENIYRTALAAITCVGAALMFVPGAQIIGAGLIIFVGLISIADAIGPFPFTWRREKRIAKVEIKTAKEAGANTADIKRELKDNNSVQQNAELTNEPSRVVTINTKYKPTLFREYTKEIHYAPSEQAVRALLKR